MNTSVGDRFFLLLGKYLVQALHWPSIVTVLTGKEKYSFLVCQIASRYAEQ